MEGGAIQEEEMDFMSSDVITTAMETSADQENQEASLESESLKPRSTAELKGMLLQAGTELTVKYLTGKITFEEFSRNLEKSDAEPQSLLQSRASRQNPTQSDDLSSLPNFELMMDQVYSGEEEESEDDDKEEQEEEDEGELDCSGECPESSELTDSKDQDWVPAGRRGKKAAKRKGLRDRLFFFPFL
ncbi:hypothetical protein PoB_003409800 [Plakobranchus ocellatus]|uniref:Uncharacterized protein n=1 Tax=Plakobranchus ocellatus TaxID=259542 RepID=A0AAV4ALA9_9GAST|nr:hypothetical protein PoB_003409800 [Plakobranchus ocellatus]